MEVTALLIAVAAVVLVWLGINRLSQDVRAEVQTLRQDMQQSLVTQVGQLTQSFNQQLANVRSSVEHGLANAGQLSSQAQQAVGQRLSEATQLMTEMREKVGGLQEAGHDLQATARALESVLSGARTRGSFGELALERMLADVLPQDRYELQYRFAGGATVDAAVRLRDKLLPIDSKFPLDSYRRLLDAANPEEQEPFRKEFARAVRKHVDDIAEKYLVPAEDTLEVALMFLPSEGVYYELLQTEDSKGALPEYCRSRKVIPVSPNTLYAYLAVVLMGLKGLQVEENARLLLGRLSGLQTDMQALDDTYTRLGTHLKNAQQSYSEAEGKLAKLERSLSTLAQGAEPEAIPAQVTEPES